MRQASLSRLAVAGVMMAVCLMILALQPIYAQENLLRDPGFEDTNYKQVTSGENAIFNVPSNWEGWVTLTPRSQDWMNRMPNGYPHTGLFKIEQARSLSISRGFATFTAAVYQSVTVPEDANVTASARGFMERSAGGAAPTPGGRFRVGIDPNGGSNPLAGGIVWSSWVTAAGGWQQASVDATASGTRVTLFLYVTQSEPSDPNVMYWDDAFLGVGGGGGTVPDSDDPDAPTLTPVIPTPAFVPFVNPQGEQEDGSIVHIVQPGDTIDSIGVAYGVTRQEILDLNPDIGSGRFIFEGQELLIRAPADSGDDEDDEGDDEITTTPEADDDAEPTDSATEESDDAELTLTPTVDPTASEIGDEETTSQEDPSTIQPTEPAATSTTAPPAPVTEVASNNQQDAPDVTAICVFMFEDANQNRIQENEEILLGDATITVNRDGEQVGSYSTDGLSEPFCFDDITPGEYVAFAVPPEGYGMTTASELTVMVPDGLAITTRFGAAEGVQAILPPPADTGDESPSEVVDEVAAVEPLETIAQNIGLILFAAAGVVLVIGLGAAFVLRRG